MQGGARLSILSARDCVHRASNPIDPFSVYEYDQQKECLTTNIPEGFRPRLTQECCDGLYSVSLP